MTWHSFLHCNYASWTICSFNFKIVTKCWVQLENNESDLKEKIVLTGLLNDRTVLFIATITFAFMLYLN
jgi:hypothetical protein